MLTNVCIYWFNANITSSMRLYKEAGGDLKELLGLKVLVGGHPSASPSVRHARGYFSVSILCEGCPGAVTHSQVQPAWGMLQGCCCVDFLCEVVLGPVQCSWSGPRCSVVCESACTIGLGSRAGQEKHMQG